MTSSWTALYVAYTIVWLGVFAYMFYMHIRQRSVERDLRTLREELLKHGK